MAGGDAESVECASPMNVLAAILTCFSAGIIVFFVAFFTRPSIPLSAVVSRLATVAFDFIEKVACGDHDRYMKVVSLAYAMALYTVWSAHWSPKAISVALVYLRILFFSFALRGGEGISTAGATLDAVTNSTRGLLTTRAQGFPALAAVQLFGLATPDEGPTIVDHVSDTLVVMHEAFERTVAGYRLEI